MKEEEKRPSEVKIQIDEQTANGTYSNLAMIAHSESEFILDFIFFQPQNTAKVRSRVIMSPTQVKRTLEALKDNIAKYEAKFGPIKEPLVQTPEPKTGYFN